MNTPACAETVVLPEMENPTPGFPSLYAMAVSAKHLVAAEREKVIRAEADLRSAEIMARVLWDRYNAAHGSPENSEGGQAAPPAFPARIPAAPPSPLQLTAC